MLYIESCCKNKTEKKSINGKSNKKNG